MCGSGGWATKTSALEEAQEFFGEGVFGEVFEFAGVEEEAQACGAAVEDDVRLCRGLGGAERGLVAWALSHRARGGVAAGDELARVDAIDESFGVA